MVDSDGTCPECQAGLEQFCPNATFTYNADKHLGGVTYGGYSDSIVVEERFVLRVPSNLDLAGAAPLLCAGITTYSPMRRAGVADRHGFAQVRIAGAASRRIKPEEATSSGKYAEPKRANAASRNTAVHPRRHVISSEIEPLPVPSLHQATACA